MKGSFPSIERIWVYAAPRPLTKEERHMVEAELQRFISDWSDHGVRLQSGYDILYDRFIILSSKNPHGRVDGCAIDTSLNFIKQLGAKLNIDFLDRMTFHYLKDGEVHTVKRPEVANLLAEGEINDETLFFNTLVQTREEYEKSWLMPFKSHWVKRLVAPAARIS